MSRTLWNLERAAVEAISLLGSELVVGNLVRRDFKPEEQSIFDVVPVVQPKDYVRRHGKKGSVDVSMSHLLRYAFPIYNLDMRAYLATAMGGLSIEIDRLITLHAYDDFSMKLDKGASRVESIKEGNAFNAVISAREKLNISRAPENNRHLILDIEEERILARAGAGSVVVGFEGWLAPSIGKLKKNLSLAWHRDAMVLATRYVRPNPNAIGTFVTAVDGWGLRVSQYYDHPGNPGGDFIMVEMLFGIETLDPTLAIILED